MGTSYYRLWFTQAKRWYLIYDSSVESNFSQELSLSPVNFADPSRAIEEYNVYKESIKKLGLLIPEMALEHWYEKKDGSKNMIWQEILN